LKLDRIMAADSHEVDETLGPASGPFTVKEL
jgi:hypothetical protein